jgi:hypothetical protein
MEGDMSHHGIYQDVVEEGSLVDLAELDVPTVEVLRGVLGGRPVAGCSATPWPPPPWLILDLIRGACRERERERLRDNSRERKRGGRMERTWAAGSSGIEVGVAGHDGLGVELGEWAPPRGSRIHAASAAGFESSRSESAGPGGGRG